MLAVGSAAPGTDGAGPSSRNQPSGHSPIVHPAHRCQCLLRLYLEDGLTAKSAAEHLKNLALPRASPYALVVNRRAFIARNGAPASDPGTRLSGRHTR